MNPLALLAVAVGGVGALALLASGSRSSSGAAKSPPSPRIAPKGIADAFGKGAFGALGPATGHTGGLEGGRVVQGKGAGIIGPSPSLANTPGAARLAAARAALAKYGPSGQTAGGFSEFADFSGRDPTQRPYIARAILIVPEMMALRFDVGYDLAKAGDGTIPDALDVLKSAVMGEVSGDQSEAVRDAAAKLTGNETSGEHAKDLYQAGKGVAEIYTGDFVGGAQDVFASVSDWFSANREEARREEFERRAIDFAKQLIEGIIHTGK